ncbi:hypothetical protein ACQ4PT_043512 [Festuca glaucescens]
MAGSVEVDHTEDGRSSSTEDLPSDQQSYSGESLAEWRSSEQVENGTPSTSPAYSDTDDDDCGPRPAELYGKFTWRIDNFSQINKRELRSNSFDVGGYKWYILIYPQGCDVCNHLSLFLCVANHDKLLPGWSHFAQFTIAVINKDPKKSKYSDTLHRFWKKEHDWGWKKFMELSKLHDGFVVEDVLTIKAQVQVIREKVDRPFRCLDGQYRRELVRVYLSNVEQICQRFIDERRSKLCRLIEDRLRWSRATLDTLPHQPLPAKDEKSSQNRTKDSSSGDDFNKDSIERDDRRLIELGWKTLEFFALAHIFSAKRSSFVKKKLLGLQKIELKAKRSAAEKEKRIRKKQAKQKKNNQKNNKGKSERFDMKDIVIESNQSDDRIPDDFSSHAEEMISNADNPDEASEVSDNRDDNSEVLHIDFEDRESSPVNSETDASETQAMTAPEGGEAQNDQAGKRTSCVDDSSSTCSSDSIPSVILNGSSTEGAWTSVKSLSNRGNNRRNKDTDTRTGLAHGGSNSAPNGIFGSSNSKDMRLEAEDYKVVSQKKQNAQRHVDVMSPSKLRVTESSFPSMSPVKKQPIFSQQPKSSLESTNSLISRTSEVSGAAATTTRTGVSSTPTVKLVPSKGPTSNPPTHIERSVPVVSRPLQIPVPTKPEAQKPTSLVNSATTTQVITVSRPLSAPQVPAAKQAAPDVSTVQTAPALSRSRSAVGRLGNEPSASAPSYIPRSYRNAMMEKRSAGTSGLTHQTSSSGQGVTHSQSMFSSSPSILSPDTSSRKENSSLKPGFTFGTVKPESLNQWREESSQEASCSSSSSNDHGVLNSSMGNEFAKLSLNGIPRSKQLLSEISTRFTPYQPQGLVGDEFPHLDIINELLDEELSDRRKVLQPGFARQFSLPNNMPSNASTPDYGMFSDPYLFDQSEQYYDEELAPYYSDLNSAPQGLRDWSYSQFDLPSYSSSQFDDMAMSQWPYSRADDSSVPSFGADVNAYPYQLRDYPTSANGASSRYPSYHPANGH